MTARPARKPSCVDPAWRAGEILSGPAAPPEIAGAVGLGSPVAGTLNFEAAARVAHGNSLQLDSQLQTRLRHLEHVVIEPAGILYDSSLWTRWLLALLSRMGWRSSFRPFAHVLRVECLQAVYAGRCSRDAALGKFLRGLGLNSGQAAEVLAASGAWRRQLDSSLRPLPGVRKAVTLLQQAGVQISILADSEETAAGMTQRLQGLGFQCELSVVQTSRDFGCTKPEVGCYQALQARLGCDRRSLAFVGHDANDLAAATSLGWLSVGCHHEPSVEAHLHLNRLEDLAGHLAQCKQRAAAG